MCQDDGNTCKQKKINNCFHTILLVTGSCYVYSVHMSHIDEWCSFCWNAANMPCLCSSLFDLMLLKVSCTTYCQQWISLSSFNSARYTELWRLCSLLLNCCVTLWCLTSWSWRIGIFLKSRVTWSTFPLHLRVRRLRSGIGNIGAPWANGIYSPEKWIARCEVANNMHYMKPLTIVVNTE